MRALRLVVFAGLLALGTGLLSGCSAGGTVSPYWWDPCPGPDCAPLGDPCDCCDSCG